MGFYCGYVRSSCMKSCSVKYLLWHKELLGEVLRKTDHTGRLFRSKMDSCSDVTGHLA